MRVSSLPVLVVLLALVGISRGLAGEPAAVSGVVMRDGIPLEGARVRVQATANLTSSASDGSFILRNLPPGETVTVTAWYSGCKVAWVTVTPPVDGVVIALRDYDTRDNPYYAWNTSYPDPANPTLGCGHCMSPAFAEWQRSAHAASATNQRFFSIYNGTDITGTISVAPGFKMDETEAAGNCAACHAPGAAANAPLTTDMNTLSGVNREGVFCEFCHKIGEVYLDALTGRPFADAPGVLSLRLHRTFPGDALFFGTLDDVTRRVSYLPLQEESEFCAPCHQFSFHGTPIYESFREWQESPYAAQGIECQSCHMPPGSSPTFVLPEKGGLERDPSLLGSHFDLGLKDVAFMQSSVSLTVTAQALADALVVTVTITNSNAGHDVPTDYPGRNMLLLVNASDATGSSLAQKGGPRVPSWGGSASGLPGQVFAKVLQDTASGGFPVVSYWKPTTIRSDNRIAALASDTSVYLFDLPEAGGRLRISAQLLYRRAFAQLMQDKGWQEPDLVLQDASLDVDAPGFHRLFLPTIVCP